jgi:GAF domain-containing protein
MGAPDSAHPSLSLIEAFSEIAQHVYASEDHDDSLRRITETATAVIHGCEAASLSLLERHGPVTRASTAPLATDGDQIQYDEGEGPCLDATMQERWLYTPDVATDRRWPRSSTRLGSELGVGSMISCRLTLDAAPLHTLGGLNLYSTSPDAFAEDDQMLAILLASLGAVVVDASRQQAHLRAAIESRQVIGEAVGIVRSQSKVSSEEAFAMLSKASQRMNVKLRDLAERIAHPETDNPEDPGGVHPPAV